MAKFLTNEQEINELADEVINASSSAFSYFYNESKDLVDLKKINTVELYIFYVCHIWIILESHLMEIGADRDDFGILIGTIAHKFYIKVMSLLSSSPKTSEIILNDNNIDFWSKELNKHLTVYRQLVAEGGIEKFMNTAYSNIIKSKDDLHSATGKVFLGSVYSATTHIEEKFKELIQV